MSEQTFVSDEWIGTQVLSLFPNLDTQYQKTGKEEDTLHADILYTAQRLSQAINEGKSASLCCIWTETYLGEYGRLEYRVMFGVYVAKLGKVVVYDEIPRKSPDTNDFHLPSIEEAEYLSIITGARDYKDISFPEQGIVLFHPWLSVGRYYDCESGVSRKCRSYSAEHQFVRLYEPCDFIRTYIYQLRLPSWYRKNISEDIKAAQSVHSIKGAPQTVVDDRILVSQPIHTDDPTNTPAVDWEKMTSENNDIQEYLKQHPDKVKEYNEWLINNL